MYSPVSSSSAYIGFSFMYSHCARFNTHDSLRQVIVLKLLVFPLTVSVPRERNYAGCFRLCEHGLFLLIGGEKNSSAESGAEFPVLF